MKEVLSGNYTVSKAVLLCRAQVIAAYPITPQSNIVEKLSEYCGTGELDARFLKVESEHSALASCIGASQVGARVFTATSAQGLALMHELLHWATGARLPIVMVNINRAMAAPWTIWCDQNDSLSQRDTGWLQFYCESCQEVLDSVVQAYRISEQVLLPSMVLMDGFYLSHTSELVDVPHQEDVDAFLPKYRAEYRLNPEDPHAFHSGTLPPHYYELRRKIQLAAQHAQEVVEEVASEFAQAFGRRYEPVEGFWTDDAEVTLVGSGTAVSTARGVVKAMRKEGKKVGLLKVRLFRPFPAETVRELLGGAEKVAVIDRNISFGQGGIFCQEVRSALCALKERPQVFGFIAGLGGLDITPKVIWQAVEHTLREDRPAKEVLWIK